MYMIFSGELKEAITQTCFNLSFDEITGERAEKINTLVEEIINQSTTNNMKPYYNKEDKEVEDRETENYKRMLANHMFLNSELSETIGKLNEERTMMKYEYDNMERRQHELEMIANRIQKEREYLYSIVGDFEQSARRLNY